MTKLNELFEEVDRKYDDFYEQYYNFNDNSTNEEKERLLYRIKTFKEELRAFERVLKDMYIPKKVERR